MTDRIKTFVYIRVKDDTHQTDWILGGDDMQPGTIAVAVPEFSEHWKAIADETYASQFDLSREAILTHDDEEERAQVESARTMLLEQDYQFAAEIENTGDPERGFYEVNVGELQSDQTQWQDGVRFLSDGLNYFDSSTYRDWEGSFRIIQAEAPKSGPEFIAQALADGKHVLCAVPFPLGSRGMFLDASGGFGAAFAVTAEGVKRFNKLEAFCLFADMRAVLEAQADDDVSKAIMRMK